MTPSQEPVGLSVDQGKVLAWLGIPGGQNIKHVTSWQQANELAGDRGLAFGDQLAEIEAVLGPKE